MLPYINLFNLNFPVYMILNGVGLIVAITLLCKLLYDRSLLRPYIYLILLSLIGMYIGAKAFGFVSSMLYEWSKAGTVDIYNCIVHSGIVYYGGLLGFLLTAKTFIYFQKNDIPDKRIINNIIIIPVPLFHSFGRLGCFFAGCCYGKIAGSDLGFPYRISVDSQYEIRYPTQLFEAIFEMLMFIILLSLFVSGITEKRGRSRNLLSIYLCSYAIFRFIIEFFRGDSIRGVVAGISFSQIISVILIITYIIIFVLKKHSQQRSKGQ